MANEIKIRAKKISDLNQDANFDFENKGGETFLIVAYKNGNQSSIILGGHTEAYLSIHFGKYSKL